MKLGPQVGQTKVDKILTQFSLYYSNKSYIGELIAPPLKVKEKTGKIAKYGKENLRIYPDGGVRLPGERAGSLQYSVSLGDYKAVEHSWEHKVPDEMQNNQDDPYDAKRDGVRVCMDTLWNNQEYALANAMADAAVITNNVTLTGADQWNNGATSDPYADIELAITTVRKKIAQRPNSITMGYDVFKALKTHPMTRDNMKFTNGGQPSDQDFGNWLKQYFNLQNVFVGESVGNLALPGQTDDIEDLWGKHCWLHYTPPTPGILIPSFAYTIFDIPRESDQYREEGLRSDIVRVRYSYDQNVTDPDACYAIFNAIA